MPHRFPTCRVAATLLLAAVAGIALGSIADAQQQGQFQQPIYRVAHEQPVQQPAEQPPQLASRINPPATQAPFDLTQRPGEHPLMPALRVAQEGLASIDASVQDYSAMLYKHERIDGELQEDEVAYIKVRHNPFSVWMYFLKPHKGRECLYNANTDGTVGKLMARDCGWRSKFGVVELDPEGRMAMKGQKYPIFKLGVRNLTSELIDVATNDVQFAECEVRTTPSKINGRAVTLIEVTHPVPRQNFRFHKAQVFIDNELRVPIRYAAYLWPENPGDPPPLEEAYTYLNVKVNNGFTDADFDRENPEVFK